MTNLQKYIHAALKKAKYVFDEDTHNFIGYIEELPLCWAQGDTIEDVREELESVVEGWILLSIRSGEVLPIISNTHFNIPSKHQPLQYA